MKPVTGRAGRRVESDPVVGDLQNDGGIFRAQPHLRAAGARVARDVPKRVSGDVVRGLAPGAIKSLGRLGRDVKQDVDERVRAGLFREQRQRFRERLIAGLHRT